MQFSDRMDAAAQLLPLLEKYASDPGVVFAVPRGGVPIGFVLAQHFKFPLELLLTKKIGHPLNKELAVGAVSLDGYELHGGFELPDYYIQQEVSKITSALRDRYKKFMGEAHQPTDVTGKTIIIVDDGVATGSTILEAVKVMRKKNPAKIIVAVPVASPRALEKIKTLVTDVICIHAPEDFMGVGQFYTDFTQVTDEEVEELLQMVNKSDKAA